jgi:hypothetical protein
MKNKITEALNKLLVAFVAPFKAKQDSDWNEAYLSMSLRRQLKEESDKLARLRSEGRRNTADIQRERELWEQNKKQLEELKSNKKDQTVQTMRVSNKKNAVFSGVEPEIEENVITNSQ